MSQIAPERRARIRSLLQEKSFTSQRVLAQSLKEQGLNISLSTLSRDLKRMGVIRRGPRGGKKLALPAKEQSPFGLAAVVSQQGHLLTLDLSEPLDADPARIQSRLESRGLLGIIPRGHQWMLVCRDEAAALQIKELVTNP